MDISDRGKFVVRREGGGSVIDCRPIFSLDVKYLFVVWDNVIRSYNVKTGEYVCEYNGLNKRAIGVQLNPNNPDLLVACSESGEVIEWDWRKKIPPREIPRLDSLQQVIAFHLIASSDSSNEQNFTVVLVSSSKEGVNIDAFDSIIGKKKWNSVLARKLNKCTHSYAFGGKPDEAYIAWIRGKELCVAELSNHKFGDKQCVNETFPFTCVTCHFSEKTVLTGDIQGRVLLWKGFFSKSRPVVAVYHWHTLPVEDVGFSAAGFNFYSAGSECVLVKWTVNKALEKNFLPRLSAALKHVAVAPDNTVIAISTLDNAIHLVESTFKPLSSIQHFSRNLMIKNGLKYMFPTGLIFDPRTEALILNGRTGHVQFYSPRQKSVLYQLNITGRNYYTQERNKDIMNVDVVQLAVNSSGHWLATVEYCEVGINSELRLKFWEYVDSKQTYSLNTCIEYPHKNKVHGIEFQPSLDPKQQMLVTIGDDLKFRIWSLLENTSIYNKGHAWQNESVGFYRNLSAHDLNFSVDGSLLAVAFGPSLTVWIPETNELKCSLTRSDTLHELSHVRFGQKECLHLVVTGSKGGIAVWNILSLSLLWKVSLRLSLLVSDSASSLMAAFTTLNDIALFHPNNSEAVHKQCSAISRDDIRILSAVFVNSSKFRDRHETSSQLYFVSSNQELLVLEPEELEGTEEKGGNNVLPSKSQKPTTAFGALVAQQMSSDVQALKVEKHEQLGIPGATTIRDMLMVPAHTSAPMSLLCGSLLLSLVASGLKQEEDCKETGSDKDEPLILPGKLQWTVKEETNSAQIERTEMQLLSALQESYDWAQLLTEERS